MSTEYAIADSLTLTERSDLVWYSIGAKWSKEMTANQLRKAIIRQIEVISYISEDPEEILNRFNVQYGQDR